MLNFELWKFATQKRIKKLSERLRMISLFGTCEYKNHLQMIDYNFSEYSYNGIFSNTKEFAIFVLKIREFFDTELLNSHLAGRSVWILMIFISITQAYIPCWVTLSRGLRVALWLRTAIKFPATEYLKSRWGYRWILEYICRCNINFVLLPVILFLCKLKI